MVEIKTTERFVSKLLMIDNNNKIVFSKLITHVTREEKRKERKKEGNSFTTVKISLVVFPLVYFNLLM